jgi:hypothetical protein
MGTRTDRVKLRGCRVRVEVERKMSLDCLLQQHSYCGLEKQTA